MQPQIILPNIQPDPTMIIPPQFSPSKQQEFPHNYQQQLAPSFYPPPIQTCPPQIYREPIQQQPLRPITQIQNIPPQDENQFSLDKEANYNFQISKMNEKIIEQKRSAAELERHLQDAQNQIDYLQHQNESYISENSNYKETLKKMYTIYVQQQKQIENSKVNEIDLQQQNFKMSEKNGEFNMSIQNMINDQDHMVHQFNQQNMMHQNEIKNMTTQLQDKQIETQELKRKINDLLDLKRRLEDENSSLRFTLDNQRAAFELDCKERQVKFDQMTACTRDELNILRMERDDAFHRLAGLADDNKIQFEQIKFLEIELARARAHAGQQSLQEMPRMDMSRMEMPRSATQQSSSNNDWLQSENQALKNENEKLKRQVEDMHKSELLKDDQIRSLSENPENRKMANFSHQETAPTMNVAGKLDDEFMINVTSQLFQKFYYLFRGIIRASHFQKRSNNEYYF